MYSRRGVRLHRLAVIQIADIFLVDPTRSGAQQHCPSLRASNPPFQIKDSLVDPRLRASNESFPILHAPLKGVAEAALYCAHRASSFLLHALRARRMVWRLAIPSFRARQLSLLEGGLFDLPLRAFNEGLLRPRVARAQETNRLPSLSSIRTTSSPLP